MKASLQTLKTDLALNLGTEVRALGTELKAELLRFVSFLV